MAARDFNIVSEVTGLPLPGALGDMSVSAWEWTGANFAPVAAPPLSEVGGGTYRLTVTDAMEAARTLVLIETGHEPAFALLAIYKPDWSNQFFPVLLVDASASPPVLWSGVAPTITAWTGSITPPLSVAQPGVYAIVPTALDLEEVATGTVTAPAGASPPEWFLAVDVLPPAAPATTQPIALVDFNSRLGIDVATFPDLSDTFMLISGKRAVAEAIYRRLTTPRGSLPFHPDVGVDVRSYLNEDMTLTSMSTLRSDVEQEVKRDERVNDAQVTSTFNTSTESLEIVVQVGTDDGPFRLTLNVTSLTATMLFEE